MTCNQWFLYQAGELDAHEQEAFKEHLASCKECQINQRLSQAVQNALVPQAAPAALVEQIFTKTTRKPSWWKRWQLVWAGGLAVLLLAVGWVNIFQDRSLTNSELVAYMSQSNQDEYADFLSDLDLFEQTF